jgi:hypothetical protein
VRVASDAPTNKKDRPKAASLNPDGDVGQAKRNDGPLFRRYAIKPSPQKPRMIIAQVEGSGMAATSEIVRKLVPVTMLGSVKVLRQTEGLRDCP